MTTYVMRGGLFGTTRRTSDPAVVGAWTLLGYRVVEEIPDEPAPVTTGPNGLDSDQNQNVNPVQDTDTSGASTVNKDTDLTQDTNTTKNTTQGTANTTRGDNNTTLVVTPSADSSMDLKSQSEADNTVSQVVTTSGSSQSTSAQANEQVAMGANVTVSPVLTIEQGDTYVSTTDSSSSAEQSGIPWWTAAVAGAAGIVGVLILRKKKKKKKVTARASIPRRR